MLTFKGYPSTSRPCNLHTTARMFRSARYRSNDGSRAASDYCKDAGFHILHRMNALLDYYQNMMFLGHNVSTHSTIKVVRTSSRDFVGIIEASGTRNPMANNKVIEI